jgi:hypothetical protein
MYDPLAKDQIGANIFAATVGHHAYQNGATPTQALSTGILWRYWYKNISFGIFLFIGTCVATGGGIAKAVDEVPDWELFRYTVWLAPLQLIVSIFVFGITYVSLIDMSGFRQRFGYRLFAPIQHAMPNVARFWWYLLLLLPIWVALWLGLFFAAAPVAS